MGGFESKTTTDGRVATLNTNTNTNAMKYKYKIMRCHLKYKCKYNEMQIQNVSEFESKTTTGRRVATSNTNESEAILCSDVSAKGQSRTSS